MAEFVEFRCEEWIPEVEKLERIRLFEPKEIKSLVTRRREFEYKLERRSKSKEDFLKYIQFEVDLLKIVATRREKTGIKSNRVEIEGKQIRRIVRLFKQTIFRHPNDIKLWMSLFKFCNDVGEKVVASKMLVRMLQYHTDKPDLWIYASEWELQEGKSVDNARKFLTKGLRHHPTSQKLYLELFKLELNQMKKKMKLKEAKLKKNKWISDEVSENIISGKVVQVVYESAIKAINEAEFMVDLLNETKETFPELQEAIFRDLMRCHPNEEVTWDTMAKREYQGLSTNCSELSGDDGGEEENEKDVMSKRIQKCIAVYKEAVEKVNTPKMWAFYLNHVTEIYWRGCEREKYPMVERKILQDAMEGALVVGRLSEDHLLNWIEALLKSERKNDNLEEVMSRGTEAFPKSVALWHARIRYHLSNEQEEKGKAAFEKAVKHVEDGTALWELMIEYFKLKKSEEVEETFQRGLAKGGEVAQSLKPQYLEWLAEAKGLEEARRAFERAELQHPPCLNLYRVMMKLESEGKDYQVERVRKCHELATSYFGQNDPKVWLDLIDWEMKKGDVTRVHQIHRRALNCLNPEKADEFLTEFNIIKTNVSSSR